ncbi:unnamed protein product [Cuscuta epithymum]|nr:unnamed protein product [Cuscuta epithymum]
MNQIQRALLLCASIHRLHRIVHTPSSNSSQAITVVGSAAGRRVSGSDGDQSGNRDYDDGVAASRQHRRTVTVVADGDAGGPAKDGDAGGRLRRGGWPEAGCAC